MTSERSNDGHRKEHIPELCFIVNPYLWNAVWCKMQRHRVLQHRIGSIMLTSFTVTPYDF